MLPAAPSVGDQPQDDVAVALAWAAERRQAIERLGVEIRGLGWSGLRRSRLSCGQNVSNAAGGAEQDKRDSEAPCYPKRAPSTRWPMRARRRQGLERDHRPGRPNPFGAALVGVGLSHQKLA